MSNTVHAYTDGSFDNANGDYGVYGAGVVIINNGVVSEFNYADSKEEYSIMRNIAGELEAAKFAMYYALSNGIKEITIHHDYIGVGAWCTGQWRAKKDYTQAYVEYYRKITNKGVKINFVKVKAHSGIKHNERADVLANEAIKRFLTK